jgi:hypothetical protein
LVQMGYSKLHIDCIDSGYKEKDLKRFEEPLSWLFRNARCTIEFYSDVNNYRKEHIKREAERIVSIDFVRSSHVEEISRDLIALKNCCLKNDKKSTVTGIYHTNETISSTKILRSDSFGSTNSLREQLSLSS